MTQDLHEDYSIQLKDRLLWLDGDTTVNSDFIVDLILTGQSLKPQIRVDKITNEIKEYNTLESSPLNVKGEMNLVSPDLNIPEKYKNIDLKEYILDLLENRSQEDTLTDEETTVRFRRVLQELKLFNKYEKNDLLKCLIYIIDTMKNEKVVWGIGRGSSCSSYILYLIGVHDVDSVKYELELDEFFR